MPRARARRAPKAPEHLSGVAKEAWRKIASEAVRAGSLGASQQIILAGLCHSYAVGLQAHQAIRLMGDKDKITGGLVVKVRGGGIAANPLVQIASRAFADMMRAATALGLSASAEPDDDKQLDLFD